MRSPNAMGPVDFDAEGLQLTACASCGPQWWAEVVVRDEMVLVREWHRRACPYWGDAAFEGVGVAQIDGSAEQAGLLRAP